MNETLDTIFGRRSQRCYNGRPVEREKLELIVKAAFFAPSARNLQTRHFCVVTDSQIMKELAEGVRVELGRDRYDFYNPGALILCGDRRDSEYKIEDCAVSMENIMLAAHSLGLGSLWINQFRGICDSARIRPLLNKIGMPGTHTVQGMAAIGYCDVITPRAEKRENNVSWY